MRKTILAALLLVAISLGLLFWGGWANLDRAAYDATDQVFRINDRNNSSDPNDDAELFRVDADGNVYAGGALVHSSDVNAKQDFAPIDKNGLQFLFEVPPL